MILNLTPAQEHAQWGVTDLPPTCGMSSSTSQRGRSATTAERSRQGAQISRTLPL